MRSTMLLMCIAQGVLLAEGFSCKTISGQAARGVLGRGSGAHKGRRCNQFDWMCADGYNCNTVIIPCGEYLGVWLLFLSITTIHRPLTLFFLLSSQQLITHRRDYYCTIRPSVTSVWTSRMPGSCQDRSPSHILLPVLTPCSTVFGMHNSTEYQWQWVRSMDVSFPHWNSRVTRFPVHKT